MQSDTKLIGHLLPIPTIRRAAEADAARLHQFMAAIVAERLPVLFRRDRAPTVDEEIEFIRQIDGKPRSTLFVAEAGDEIVGMLDFHAHQKPQRSHAGEFGMSVAKAWRGKGIGSHLLSCLIEWASAEGLRRVELTVFSNNPAALAVYERAGFVREGSQREAVEVDGRYVDLVYMVRMISPTTASAGPAT